MKGLIHLEEVQKFHIFEPKFNNDELENEFHKFFRSNNLTPLFTNEHKTTAITYTYLDAKSVVNESGKYHNFLLDFTDYLLLATDNKSYEEALLKVLYKSNTFQGLMNNIKKLKNFIDNGIDDDKMFNMWNIVWYKKDLL